MPTRQEVVEAFNRADAAAQNGDAQAAADAKYFADQIRAMDKAAEVNELEESDVDIRGAGQTFMKGLLYGGADEVEGAIGAFLDQMTGLADEQAALLGEEAPTMGESYEARRSDAQASQEAFAEANPGLAMGLEIGGALVSPGSVAAGALAKGGQVARAAAVGAADAGVYGFLAEDGDLGERAQAGLETAVLGGVAGGTLAVAGKRLKGWQEKRALEKVNSEALETINKVQEELTVAVAKTGKQDADTWTAALHQAGVSNDELAEAVAKTGHPKLAIPKPGENTSKAAEQILSVRKNGFNDPDTYMTKWKERFENYVANPYRYMMQPISTTVRTRAPLVFKGLREMEGQILRRQQGYVKEIHGLKKLKKAVDPRTYESIGQRLMNGEFKAAKALAPPEYAQLIDKAEKMLANIKKEQEALGYTMDTVVNYWPRKVKNLKGFRQALSGQERTELEQFIADMTVKNGKALSRRRRKELEAQWYLNRGTMSGDARPGFTKARTVPWVSSDMVKYYEDPITSVMEHIHRSAEDIEMKKFFNKSGAGGRLDDFLKKQADAEVSDADTQAILYNAIDDLIEKSNIHPDDAPQIRQALGARFGGGRQAMNPHLAKLKDVITSTKLAQVDSTLTQIGDLYASFYVNGIMPTMKTLLETAAKGDKRLAIQLDRLGVDNILSQDVRTNMAPTSEAADALLNITQFKLLDRFGKRTFVNSANKRLQSQMKSARGEKSFRRKWGDVYSPAEMNRLVADFRAGRASDHVYMHMFHELSDIQPITSLEMPAAYLDNPNLRIAYTLKSFVVRTVDRLKQDVIDETRKGRPGTALMNLTKFGLYYGAITGTVEEAKDLIRGDDFDPEDIPDNAVEALLSLVNMNRYASQDAKRGDLVGWGMNFFAPPIPGVQQAVRTSQAILSEDKDEEDAMLEAQKLLQDMPILGRIFYGYTEAGQERQEEREDEQEDESIFRN